MGDVGEVGHAEHERAEGARHEDEDAPGIATRRFPEVGDTVGDRLEARERRAAVGERLRMTKIDAKTTREAEPWLPMPTTPGWSTSGVQLPEQCPCNSDDTREPIEAMNR